MNIQFANFQHPKVWITGLTVCIGNSNRLLPGTALKTKHNLLCCCYIHNSFILHRRESQAPTAAAEVQLQKIGSNNNWTIQGVNVLWVNGLIIAFVYNSIPAPYLHKYIIVFPNKKPYMKVEVSSQNLPACVTCTSRACSSYVEVFLYFSAVTHYTLHK